MSKQNLAAGETNEGSEARQRAAVERVHGPGAELVLVPVDVVEKGTEAVRAWLDAAALR